MSELVRVAPAVLLEMEQRLRQLPKNIAVARVQDFSKSGEVDGAYESMMGRWNDHRNDMRDQLDQIAQIFGAIREAFEQVDDQLSAGLTGEGQAQGGP